MSSTKQQGMGKATAAMDAAQRHSYPGILGSTQQEQLEDIKRQVLAITESTERTGPADLCFLFHQAKGLKTLYGPGLRYKGFKDLSAVEFPDWDAKTVDSYAMLHAHPQAKPFILTHGIGFAQVIKRACNWYGKDDIAGRNRFLDEAQKMRTKGQVEKAYNDRRKGADDGNAIMLYWDSDPGKEPVDRVLENIVSSLENNAANIIATVHGMVAQMAKIRALSKSWPNETDRKVLEETFQRATFQRIEVMAKAATAVPDDARQAEA